MRIGQELLIFYQWPIFVCVRFFSSDFSTLPQFVPLHSYFLLLYSVVLNSVSHVIFTQLFISLSSLLAKTESKSNVDSGRKMMEAVKVGHNGGILACDVRYKTKCQNNP